MMTGYKYFLYSLQFVQDKNEAEKHFGREYVPGTVLVNGTRKEYTMIEDEPEVAKYSDTRIVAEGEIEDMKYTKSSTILRRD